MSQEDEIIKRLSALEIRVAALEKGRRGPGPGPAKARDQKVNIDEKFGDPKVWKDPRSWKGESYAGCNFSECPPDYLDHYARLLEAIGKSEDDEGKDGWRRRKDAAKARAWAERKRAGEAVPAPTAKQEFAKAAIKEVKDAAAQDDDELPSF